MDGDDSYARDGDTPPAWPRISDYWPEARPLPPPVDHYEWPGADPVGGRPTRELPPARRPDAPVRPHRDARSRRRRPWWKPVLGAGLAVVVTSGVLVLTRTFGMTTATEKNLVQQPSATVAEQPSGPPEVGPVSVAPPPASSPVAESASPSAPPPPSPPAPRSPEPTALPFTAGTFELIDGTTELNVTLRSLGAEVFRVSTPEDSGVTPQVTVTGSTVRLGVTRNGKDGRAVVDLVLNRDVAWALRLTAGVEETSLDLSGGRIRRIDLIGGAARVAMVLPDQRTALPIRMSGGLNTWRIETEGEPNARVLLRDGGGTVQLGEERFDGVARGTTLETGSGEPAGRLDIDAVAGLGTLIVVRE